MPSSPTRHLVRMAPVVALVLCLQPAPARADVIDDPVARVSTTSTFRQANGSSSMAIISADGRYVFFSSTATNLTPSVGGPLSIYRKTLATGVVRLVSRTRAGNPLGGSSALAGVSATGRYVLFHHTDRYSGGSPAPRRILRKDLVTGRLDRVDRSSTGQAANQEGVAGGISRDGRYVVLSTRADNLVAGDVGGYEDVFRKDMLTGTVARVSTSTTGGRGDGDSSLPHLDATGRFVLFHTRATNLVGDGVGGPLLKDVRLGAVVRAGQGRLGPVADALPAGLSADGRYALVVTADDSMVTGDANGAPDVFRIDVMTGRAVRVSEGPDGAELPLGIGSGGLPFASISDDATRVAFLAAVEIGEKGQPVDDVVVKDLISGELLIANRTPSGSPARGQGAFADVKLRPDGRRLVFTSGLASLVPGDTNGRGDVFYARLP